MDNCAIYILNSSGELVERGQIGEVFVSGAHIADGYINVSKGSGTSFIANTAGGRKGSFSFYNILKNRLHV